MGRSSPPDSDLLRYIGPPLQEIFRSLLGSSDQREIGTAVALFRQRFSSTGIFESVVYPGIRRALSELQALRAVLYVASSRPRVFAERVLAHCALEGFFQNVYGSELNGVRSNKTELITYILEAESISPASTLLVGDRAHDIVAASANGVLPIGALWGYGSRQELVSAGAVSLCERPSRLRDALSSIHKVRPT